jgi:GNAT superfamily N-acetyltransferase
VEIRAARPDESEALMRIQREAAVRAFAHIFPPELYPFPADGVRAQWAEALEDPAIEVYVAERDGVRAGSVAVGYGFLRNLYVLPEHQGTGLGSTLHDHALERLRDLGWGEAKLWTLEGNESGRRFYEKRGWSLNGETRVVPFPPNPVDVGYSRSL